MCNAAAMALHTSARLSPLVVLVLVLVLAAAFWHAEVEGRCTAIGVGRAASQDGSILVAPTDDAGNDASDLRLVRVPAKDHAPGAMRPVYRFRDGFPRVVAKDRAPDYAPEGAQKESTILGYIPEVPHTYAYWDQEYAMINERQLAIGER